MGGQSSDLSSKQSPENCWSFAAEIAFFVAGFHLQAALTFAELARWRATVPSLSIAETTRGKADR